MKGLQEIQLRKIKKNENIMKRNAKENKSTKKEKNKIKRMSRLT
jgi:hypothetical protein